MKVAQIENLTDAINNALACSPSKTFIIEEYIESRTYASDSDSFSVKGELDFISFSDQRFDPKSPNPYTPAAYSWPSSILEENQTYLRSELQRLIHLLKMKLTILIYFIQ